MFRFPLKTILTCSLIGFGQLAVQAQQQMPARCIILMFDGLRTDYITPELMPHLYAFKQQGSYGANNHSVFPTVTRVNSASYATGSYPEKHGLLGNTVYFPQVEKSKGLNTGDASDLMRIADATSNHLLTATSLGELLAAHGKSLMVFSSGSTGQAFLQNHMVTGGGIINPGLIVPESLKSKVIAALGEPAGYSHPNTARHQWVTDAFFKFGMIPDGPLVSAIWFSDPDGTAHETGIGSPQTIQALKSVDDQFGRIIDSIHNTGQDNVFNIIISTDHGFVTYTGDENATGFLISNGLKKDKTSDDVVLADGSVYVKDHNPEVIQKIVSLLQDQPWIGAIFTRPVKPGSDKGQIAGTLSFDAIHWNHPQRAADILIDRKWEDKTNTYGYKGSAMSKGVAGHGGFSSYEVHIPLIAGGPAFKKQNVDALPTSNVDIVPTVLYLCGIPVPEEMSGRIMKELFLNEPAPKTKVKTELVRESVKTASGTYEVILERSVLGKYKYVNYSNVNRTNKGK